MKATTNPKASNMSIKGETMLMKANLEHSNAFIPWDLITSDAKWNLEKIINPRPIEKESSSIFNIVEIEDRTIEL